MRGGEGICGEDAALRDLQRRPPAGGRRDGAGGGLGWGGVAPAYSGGGYYYYARTYAHARARCTRRMVVSFGRRGITVPRATNGQCSQPCSTSAAGCIRTRARGAYQDDDHVSWRVAGGQHDHNHDHETATATTMVDVGLPEFRQNCQRNTAIVVPRRCPCVTNARDCWARKSSFVICIQPSTRLLPFTPPHFYVYIWDTSSTLLEP